MSDPRSLENLLRRPTSTELETAILAVLRCADKPIKIATLLERVRAILTHIPCIYMPDISKAGLRLSEQGKLHFTSTDGYSILPTR